MTPAGNGIQRQFNIHPRRASHHHSANTHAQPLHHSPHSRAYSTEPFPHAHDGSNSASTRREKKARGRRRRRMNERKDDERSGRPKLVGHHRVSEAVSGLAVTS